jgi:hypothetical protein
LLTSTTFGTALRFDATPARSLHSAFWKLLRKETPGLLCCHALGMEAQVVPPTFTRTHTHAHTQTKFVSTFPSIPRQRHCSYMDPSAFQMCFRSTRHGGWFLIKTANGGRGKSQFGNLGWTESQGPKAPDRRHAGSYSSITSRFCWSAVHWQTRPVNDAYLLE